MLSLCFLIKIWTLSFSSSFILNENTWKYIRNRYTHYISWRADNHKLLKIYSMIWCQHAPQMYHLSFLNLMLCSVHFKLSMLTNMPIPNVQMNLHGFSESNNIHVSFIWGHCIWNNTVGIGYLPVASNKSFSIMLHTCCSYWLCIDHEKRNIVFCYNCFSLYCMFPLKVHCREQIKYGARKVQHACVLFDMSHSCWRIRHIEYWQSFLLSQTQTDGKFFPRDTVWMLAVYAKTSNCSSFLPDFTVLDSSTTETCQYWLVLYMLNMQRGSWLLHQWCCSSRVHTTHWTSTFLHVCLSFSLPAP